MALVTCPECGRERVSDTAEACPDCKKTCIKSINIVFCCRLQEQNFSVFVSGSFKEVLLCYCILIPVQGVCFLPF